MMNIDALIKDIKYAVRWLARSPGFAAVAILSLGLGVGVNAGMFALVDALLLRPLPVASPDTLVDVFTTGGDGDVHATNSYPDFLDLKATNSVFSDTIGYSPMFAALSLGDRSRLVLGQLVTSNHFQVLGIRPELGRLLNPDDDAPGAPRVVVLSHRMWMREFGAASDIVGRTVHLRGEPYTIVGVAPASFSGVVPLLIPELWVPVVRAEEVEPAGIIDAVPGPGTTRLERRGYRWMFVKGRLKPGVRASEAAANVQVIGSRLAAAHVDTNKDRAMSAVPTSQVRMLVPEAGGPLTAGGVGVMAVVGIVLMIACANVAGLLLARASARERELSVRAAIGASRGRLVQQLLIEGVVIGVAGIVVAVAVAAAMTRLLVSIELPIRDLPLDLTVSGRVLAFALAAAVLSGLVASVSPAIKTSALSLVSVLRGPAASGASRIRRWGLREALVAGQIALTVVLLVVAGMLLRSVAASWKADLGFDTRGLTLVSFDTDMVRYTDERGRQFWDQALARVRGIPGVASASLVTPRVPLEINYSTNEFHIDDRSYAPGQRGEILHYVAVSPRYFTTLGARIVRGRDFTDADRDGTPLVAIVSEAMARTFWPDGSAVGRTLLSNNRRYAIVGVSADYKVRSVSEAPTPYVHFAAAQRPASYNTLMARTTGDADTVLASIRRELLAMEPRLVFINQTTMERTFAATLLPTRVGSMLAAGFGGLGTLLAGIGLYGVVAFAVSQRTKEIGIRVALGAERGDVLRMILRQGVTLVVVGAFVGAGFAAAASALLGHVLYGVGAADPVAWLSAIVVLIGAAAGAHLLPTLSAMRIDPARTLRDS
jgi:putative ABC transport system permease protein